MDAEVVYYKGKVCWGYKKCPVWLRNKFLERANFKCEECPSDKKLEIHRIKRGVEGGLYMVVPKNHPLNNCKVLCEQCHSIRNYSRKLNYQLTIK